VEGENLESGTLQGEGDEMGTTLVPKGRQRDEGGEEVRVMPRA
jgi:hypothetical protein